MYRYQSWNDKSAHTITHIDDNTVYIPWGDELFWYPSRYPAAGTDLNSFLLFCPYLCQIGIQMLREMKFCISYWGDTQLIIILSVFVQPSLHGYPLSKL